MKLYTYYIIVFFVFVSCAQSKNDDYTDMEPAQFQKAISADSIQLIDVRTLGEFNEGHLKNAMLIDYLSDDFSENIKKLNPDKAVYIYCRSGKRSSKSAKHFKETGFSEIYNLKGGVLEWEAKELPIID